MSLKVPHMGWNTVTIKKEFPLFDSGQGEHRFYFVHSYHVVCDDHRDVLATTTHGIEFVSSFQQGNIIGVQFHPEKSHRFGIDFFRRFIELPSPC
jgi:imidazole glycerol-phosphate synthase subunit HisH